MNMEVRIVTKLGSPPISHTAPGPIGICVPAATLPSRSPGIAPSVQTDRESAGSLPRPCANTQADTFRPMMAKVATEVPSVGLSSRRGNIGWSWQGAGGQAPEMTGSGFEGQGAVTA